jgi:tRNA U34 2-thiouridine synthase MnmA/TrmU
MTELVKAICLFSGGLDSILAVKILEAQGIEITAIKFVSPFFGSGNLNDATPLIEAARAKLGIHLEVVDITGDYSPMLKAPAHGYGKNFNPCIDCKILMVRKAGEFMKRIGAHFIATGEVIGQRPMSQRRDTMRIVERDSGMEGLLLRPLSAKLLPETLPEKEGFVKRNLLFDLSGRSRTRQMELAKTFGVVDYPSPAGGCVLTDPVLSKRIEYVVKTYREFNTPDIALCRIGRHFVWPEGTHLIVGRNKGENERLDTLLETGSYLLKTTDFPGPLGLLKGYGIPSTRLEEAAAIVARYGKGRNDTSVRVTLKDLKSGIEQVLTVAPRWETEDLGLKRL